MPLVLQTLCHLVQTLRGRAKTPDFMGFWRSKRRWVQRKSALLKGVTDGFPSSSGEVARGLAGLH
jgi:hypothetical protein